MSDGRTKPWVWWTLAAVVLMVGLCAVSGVVAWRVAPQLSRRAISTPLEASEVIKGTSWSLTIPSRGWRRINEKNAATMPVKKDLWLTHLETGAMLAVEEVPAGEGRQFPRRAFAAALVDNYRSKATEWSDLSNSLVETCGVPAPLHEFRARRPDGDFTYVLGAFVAYGRGYEVNAWSKTSDFETVAADLRKLVGSFCADDDDFSREWLRNFSEVSESDVLTSAFGDVDDAFERQQRAIDLHYRGVKRLSRKELVRHAQLLLALTKGAPAEQCAGVLRWELLATEERLKQRPAADIREWYRLERRAQEAEVQQTTAPNAASEDAINGALRRVDATPRLLSAWRAMSSTQVSAEDVCSGGGEVLKHALSLEPDERDALLRGLAMDAYL